jgi:hypothetical protein
MGVTRLATPLISLVEVGGGRTPREASPLTWYRLPKRCIVASTSALEKTHLRIDLFIYIVSVLQRDGESRNTKQRSHLLSNSQQLARALFIHICYMAISN